jgi:hypothetical protein
MLPLIPKVGVGGRRVVIHCGLARTGTSTLQQHVFPAVDGVTYLGLPAPAPALDWAIRHLCQADTLYLEAERLAGVLSKAIEAAAPDSTVVLSYENFLLYKSKDKGLIAERLKALFPDAEVLIVLRRQESMVVSRYLTNMRKQIKHGALIPFDEWWEVERREAYRSVFDDLQYARMVDYYGRLFGRERVHVLLFEQLQEDAAAYAEQLAALLGTDARQVRHHLLSHRENVAMTAGYYGFWRSFGHLLPRQFARKLAMRLRSRGGARVAINLTPAMHAELRLLCADENAALARSHGLALARYGYLLPAADAPTYRESESSQTIPSLT